MGRLWGRPLFSKLSTKMIGGLIAVADSFQAMTADRPYRKAMSVEQALTELQIRAGSQFDPEVVTVFVEILKPPQAQSA